MRLILENLDKCFYLRCGRKDMCHPVGILQSAFKEKND